jgi:hypothetical protein
MPCACAHQDAEHQEYQWVPDNHVADGIQHLNPAQHKQNKNKMLTLRLAWSFVLFVPFYACRDSPAGLLSALKHTLHSAPCMQSPLNHKHK